MAARMKDRIVLITGAAGTIGGTVAKRVEEEGGIAIRTDLASHKGQDFALDVTSESEWKSVAEAVAKKHGRLDGLVNSAGIASLGTIESEDYAQYRRTMAVNVDGTYLGCKYAMPLLKVRGGSIVNLSSVSGLVAGHNLASYNASKGAVRLLSKSVALHGARLKPPVRSNSVHPTFVEGAMVEALLANAKSRDAARERMTADVPLSRFAQPEEVANLAVFLLSDESAFITGAEIPIDGGLTAR
ncbi:MAG: SDR family oxidoreductase [Xanthobacteraceae bacterium]|nr:SDR family oxidoreductase [Xanthobacteraceae bacterium]QYK45891.1 MAG: SDR family oxidoreductase [Xanthobacteraceae bacterium]HMN52378.1 SDR family oxidoreductase [Xanthobacteraceae bacterium]